MPHVASRSEVFDSFWMGGYEGADHINARQTALDMSALSGHAAQIEADHARSAALGIRTVRESVGWRLAEPSPGRFDLERVSRIARSANEHGIQVVWSFMHYGMPGDVSLLDDRFIDRFVRFAVTLARTIGPLAGRAPVYNLINEIGFLAWAASSSDMMWPYRGTDEPSVERRAQTGFAIKRRLVAATLAAMRAIRAIDGRARFLHIDPVIHIVAPPGRPEMDELAAALASHQWQAWDMVAGRCLPELGGSPEMLDIVGVNHYSDSQWEALSDERVHWHHRDARRRPLSLLLAQAWARYQRPMILAETSHVGEGRAGWLNEIASEVERARGAGVPVEGICLYPLVDRPDWHDPAHWHHSGLWDAGWSAASTAAPVVPGDRERAPVASSVTAARAAPAASPVDAGARVLCADYARALAAWQQRLPTPSTQARPAPCLIVFSHLRWGFVYQRPQHLMTRLSRHYRVLFVEEPVRRDGPARLDRIPHGPDLDVLVPHTPIDAPGFHDDQLATLRTLLADHLQAEAIAETLVWFYTPMALPLLDTLRPLAVVYDCMDALAAFDHAPRQLHQREAALMRRADLVLTGGPALYEAKRGQHPNVHCMPSSVDAGHFAPEQLEPASEVAREAHALQGRLPRPRLGFFGVVDERLDTELLATLADAHPEWQLVMAGPVVKIDEARLPRRPNIHWLGMQPYARLPYLLAGWDLCLMPFALNDSTRFISPTKTLEYMAGERPIVSTPVRDVVGLYGDTVWIAPAGPAFVAACERALGEGGFARGDRARAMLATVRRSSWDRLAADVHVLVGAAVRPAARQPPGAVVAASVEAQRGGAVGPRPALPA